jgi:hypothetical protein
MSAPTTDAAQASPQPVPKIPPVVQPDPSWTPPPGLLDIIKSTVQQEIPLLKYVPEDVQREQFAARLDDVHSRGWLSADEVAYLLKVADSKPVSVQALPAQPHPLDAVSPDGNPQLCGTIARSLVHHQPAGIVTPSLSFGGAVTIGLATVGGATIGGILGGGPGLLFGAVNGASLAAHTLAE